MTKTPEQIADMVIEENGLRDANREMKQNGLMSLTYRDMLIEAAHAARQAAPAFKPADVPDKYRGIWQRIVYFDDSPKWLCGIQVSGPRSKSQYLEITQDQARRILETLSSEDTER